MRSSSGRCRPRETVSPLVPARWLGFRLTRGSLTEQAATPRSASRAAMYRDSGKSASQNVQNNHPGPFRARTPPEQSTRREPRCFRIRRHDSATESGNFETVYPRVDSTELKLVGENRRLESEPLGNRRFPDLGAETQPPLLERCAPRPIRKDQQRVTLINRSRVPSGAFDINVRNEGRAIRAGYRSYSVFESAVMSVLPGKRSGPRPKPPKNDDGAAMQWFADRSPG